MDIIISIIILVLLCFIFFKEFKSDKPVDLFINLVITCICIGTPLFTFFTDGLDLGYIAHVIYIIVMIVDVIYTIYYLNKYFKNKKA